MCLETDRLRLMPLLASQLMAMIENKAQLVNQLGWGIDSAELDSKMKFIYQLKINLSLIHI